MAKLIAIATLVLAGCGTQFTLTPQRGFVVLEEPHSESYSPVDDDERAAARAVNPHGVVVAVREIDNEVDGTTAFFADAIADRMRDSLGYALIETRQVTCATGERGTQLQFGRDEGTTSYLYWVTVFTSGDTLFVVEAGGAREVFEPAQAEVDATIASLELDG